ncbi:MAG: ACP S-malonyltransferase [Acidobacteria bacterium]|nr:ACP S-malonyltransferase [Acidobacteriota bacterium]
MKACVFPGQGAQTVGMGEDLFARYPEVTARAGEVLGYDVAQLCLKDPQGRLHQTQYTQPALYVVNALAYRSRCDSGLPPPDFVAGHSLGELNALLAAEVFDFEAGLRLVKRRGELMSRVSGGSMAALIGCPGEKVEEILRSHGLTGIDVANYNTPSQVVLSGPDEEIARAEDVFSGLGATYLPLKNVSAAFHSRYMKGLEEPLGEALSNVRFLPPQIPVISNVSARPYAVGELRELLKRQIREPVRWLDSILYLLSLGVEEFEEVGPGGVLTKLIKAIRKTAAGGAAPRSPGALKAGAAPAAITAERLGAASFRRDYQVRRAYAAGALDKGIASKAQVVRLGKAGYMGFFGAGGLAVGEIEESLRAIRQSLRSGEPFGVSLLCRPDDPESEMAVVELCLRHGVRFVEADGYVTPSPALIRYRLKSLARERSHKLMAKVTRPDVAAAFLEPPPEHLVAELLRAGLVSWDEARWARRVPMADDLSVEADSGASSDLGGAPVLLPSLIRQRDQAFLRHGYEVAVRIGSGGIGTPEAAASAFLLGADFIVTDTVNQCTVEAGTSDEVKDLLQTVSVQDTESAPAGDLFELGARAQVLKKGVRFPVRAGRLYDLWRRHGAWEEVDAAFRARIEREYFGRSFEQVYEELRTGPLERLPEELARAERDKHHRMALVFRWYFTHTMDLALAGTKGQKANYQVRCGPALGAFNQWVKGTRLESWRDRHVDVIADEIMDGAAAVLNRRLHELAAVGEPD